MSVLIKGVEMPDKVTTIVIFPEGKARVFRQDIDHDEWLTAIEVPTPHGDLIDRDELNKALIEMSKIEWNKGVSCSWAEAFEGVVDVVNLEIPIIEAEDGE